MTRRGETLSETVARHRAERDRIRKHDPVLAALVPGAISAYAGSVVMERDLYPERWRELRVGSGDWHVPESPQQLKLEIEAATGEKAGRGPKRRPSPPKPKAWKVTTRDAALSAADYRSALVETYRNAACEPGDRPGAAGAADRFAKHSLSAAGKAGRAEAEAFLATLEQASAAVEALLPELPTYRPKPYEFVDAAMYERAAATYDAAIAAYDAVTVDARREAFDTVLYGAAEARRLLRERLRVGLAEAEAEAKAAERSEAKAAKLAASALGAAEAIPTMTEARRRADNKAVNAASRLEDAQARLERKTAAAEAVRRALAEAEPEPVPEAVPEPEPVPEAVPEPEPVPEAVPEPEPVPEAVPEPEPVEPEPEPIPDRIHPEDPAGDRGDDRPRRWLDAAAVVGRIAAEAAPVVLPAVLAGLAIARRRRRRGWIVAGLEALEAEANGVRT